MKHHCDFLRLEGLIAVAENSCLAFLFPDVVVFCEHPTALNLDNQNRLHCENGPAIGFSDGWGVWSHHGVRVQRYIIEEPSKITVKEINSESNAEVRRVMIERFGQSKYLLESGAKEIHRDDFGTLYRKEIPGDEPLVMVKVVNSTPEPNGEFKDYFLRVPPTIQRAHQAVAWTFNKTESEYDPCLQT